MDFDEAVKYLLSLGHETLTIKLGLRNTALLLDDLDNPENEYAAAQIAGTNGKGSTAVMLDSICRAAQIKCGLYTSPHLVSMTERIKISGVPISPEEFAASVTLVRDIAEHLVNGSKELPALPTFFEQLTVSALVAFRRAEVELVILETGLGGRLDATTAAGARNVAITPIAMDHEEYLGDSLASIAAEKAAIILPGVRAVIAKQEPEALEVILKRCEESYVVPILEDGRHTIRETTPDGRFRVTFDTGANRYEDVWVGLRGRHQIDNAALAIRLAELLRNHHPFKISDAAIANGIETASHPGRLEIFPQKPPVLLDGAHNPAGSRALRDYLQEFAPRPLTLVFGAMRDKQLDQIGEILFPLADLLILTTVENPRSASIEMLRPIAERFARGKVIETAASAKALTIAMESTAPRGMIAIAGSLYLVGELRETIIEIIM